MHPNKFKVNEAWIAFKLNDAPIRTGRDGTFNCFCLMDAASCFIIGQALVPVHESEPSQIEGQRLLKEAWEHKQEFPTTLFVPTGQFQTNLPEQAECEGIAVVRVSEGELMPFIREARQSFRQYVGAQRAHFN